MKRWHWAALIILTVVSLIVEFFFIGDHDEHWWSSIPAFYILFGFAGCALIIFLSKAYGKMLVQREENYYSKEMEEYDEQ